MIKSQLFLCCFDYGLHFYNYWHDDDADSVSKSAFVLIAFRIEMIIGLVDLIGKLAYDDRILDGSWTCIKVIPEK